MRGAKTIVAALVLIILAAITYAAYHHLHPSYDPYFEPDVSGEFETRDDLIERVQSLSCSDSESGEWEQLEITKKEIESPVSTQIGLLQYQGGIHLESDDPRFGGLSGLQFVGDPAERALFAISDMGMLLRFSLVNRASSLASGIGDIEYFELKNAAGERLIGKAEADAESLGWDPETGALIIGFERRHRVGYMFPDLCGATARVVVAGTLTGKLSAIPANQSLEALTYRSERNSGDDRQVIVGLEMNSKNTSPIGTGEIFGQISSGLDENGQVVAGIELPDGFGLTGLDALDADHSFGLQRLYDPRSGNRIRILHLTDNWTEGGDTSVKLLAELEPSQFPVDNFEGIAAARIDDQTVRLFLVSDDNFSARQRTLLVAFDYVLQ